MEALKERIRDFLYTGDGRGDGGGFGSGYGDCDGNGCGYGIGDGRGGWDDSGYGSGSGHGYGYSSGSGRGSGTVGSYWYGDLYGCGHGHGDGFGDGIAVIVGRTVHDVDGVQTIITAANSGFAKGYILSSDLTMTPCYIAKGGGKFAHGATLNKAVAALQAKLFQDMPEEARISAFIKAHPDKNAKIPARDLWVWHNRLTGSCEMGRNQFAADRGIDIDKEEFTPLEFCEMCKGSYGGDVIRRLEEAYAV